MPINSAALREELIRYEGLLEWAVDPRTKAILKDLIQETKQKLRAIDRAV